MARTVGLISQERVKKILDHLHQDYPDAHCELNFASPLQLMVATILSAQCTDVRVNMVTPALFKKYKTAADFAASPPGVLEQEIHSTGFYNNKAKNIRGAAKKIVEEYGGKVPDTMEELLTLPGVARKTANVILGSIFNKSEGVVVDTHVQRLTNHLGLTKQTHPVKIEKEMMEIIPRKEWTFFGHAIVWHGRRVCKARRPECYRCSLLKLCPYPDKTPAPD